MSKKTTEALPAKRAEKKQPIELTEEQLEGAHGGVGFAARQPAAKTGGFVACDLDYKAMPSQGVVSK